MTLDKVLTHEEQLEHMQNAIDKNRLDLKAMLPDDKDVILNRMRFHYLDWGNPHLPPMVFMHGGSLTAHTWDICCLAFREEFHCLALDQRGHGDSEWSPEMDYRREAFVADLEALAGHLELDKFILVGMSLGGLNSLAYAGKHSDRLRGLVIVDVGPRLHIDAAKKITDFTRDALELPSVEAFVERAMKFNPQRDPELLRRSLLYNLRQNPDGTWSWKYDQRHRVTWNLEQMKVEQAELWNSVPLITCPTLVVRGDRSRVLLDEDAEELASRLPDGQWALVENAGHTVQGDNPRGLIEAMRRFFEERDLS